MLRTKLGPAAEACHLGCLTLRHSSSWVEGLSRMVLQLSTRLMQATAAAGVKPTLTATAGAASVVA